MLYPVPENAILKGSSDENAKITKVEFIGNIPITSIGHLLVHCSYNFGFVSFQ